MEASRRVTSNPHVEAFASGALSAKRDQWSLLLRLDRQVPGSEPAEHAGFVIPIGLVNQGAMNGGSNLWGISTSSGKLLEQPCASHN